MQLKQTIITCWGLEKYMPKADDFPRANQNNGNIGAKITAEQVQFFSSVATDGM